MDKNEAMQYVKENDLDVCPECNTRKDNTIHLNSEILNGDAGSVDCANPKCGYSWKLDVPEE